MAMLASACSGMVTMNLARNDVIEAGRGDRHGPEPVSRTPGVGHGNGPVGRESEIDVGPPGIRAETHPIIEHHDISAMT